jgi:copper(I)-binding protein
MAGGVMRMRSAGTVAIAPGQVLQMKSGGLHIMLMGLKSPLKAGQQLPLTLKFQRAGVVRLSVPISMGAPDGGHRH